MKKTDIILLSSIAFIAILAYIIIRISVGSSEIVDGSAVVVFKDKEILEIFLEDGSYKIKDTSIGITVDEDNFLFTIPNTNGDNHLVIEYKDNKVRVIEETSPQNICQLQGWSNSPLKPITCLPNNLVILIKAKDPNGIDDITS